MHDSPTNHSGARSLRVAIVASRYHADITDSMQHAAMAEFLRLGGVKSQLHTFSASGSYELTAICAALTNQKMRTGQRVYDAIIALGCIITGETTHDQYLAHSVRQGLTAITVHTGVPIGFGVLTCRTIEQARARSIEAAKPEQNKGAEAMAAAIDAAVTIKRIYATGGIV